MGQGDLVPENKDSQNSCSITLALLTKVCLHQNSWIKKRNIQLPDALLLFVLTP